ncbi:CO(2)-response secreted protease-like [Nymphaea colorata]|nr:CO(2)-response secreted protease-like [Nymphaea colorata]XP_049932149.1 CO(2)-response secreted protease-like [Nymphaea colorata]
MKTLTKYCLFFLVLTISSPPSDASKVYVVYMGSSRGKSASYHTASHVELLNSVIGREEKIPRPLIYSYRNAFSGFAAHLSETEAAAIAKKPGVVSVFPDPVFELHTTRSWDFLQVGVSEDVYHSSSSESSSSGADTIIGILDTGIWPESPSFADKDMPPVPSRWKGVCMTAKDFSASNCNKKLIGARYYNEESKVTAWTTDQTPRDSIGHGSHTSSTAAGVAVPAASYHGLATGTAKGGSPTSRLAIYRVCTSEGCKGSAILAAFEDAITDGVDLLSLSLGASPYFRPDFDSDPIAIGAFHAVENGIVVVCSAGNSGPAPGTVVNTAPWILTVGATTIDRDFESDLILGEESNAVIKGEAINFSKLDKSPIYPLIYGESAPANTSTKDDARNCNPYALDGEKVKGKIVLCEHSDRGYSKTQKLLGVKGIGGVGLVLIDDPEIHVAAVYGNFPMTVISSSDASSIFSYLNSSKNPVATILPTVTVNNYKPAPLVAYFSSRGASTQTRNIIKPDIAAPGVSILAAFIPTNDSSLVSAGETPSMFNLLSGTSMACPHVTGVAASIKSQNPTWSPSAIRSAIMTTATETNNEGSTIHTDAGSPATPYDYGSGEVNPSKAYRPGLVYEVTMEDYYLFLCNYGYSSDTIKKISGKQTGYNCPSDSSKDSISNLNYPSIAVSKFNGTERTVKRRVTNVGIGDEETTYTVNILSPAELKVAISPSTLQFRAGTKTLSYEVSFSSSSGTPNHDMFGSLTWTNGKYTVRTPFAVSNN